MSSLRWLLWLLLTCSSLAHAQAEAPRSSLELSFAPTDRVQLAVWVERDDGLFMGTLALTHAVAKAGIGNRPGALQMNSGFRWPYGRREGVLPVWAHRRASAPGARQFKRVIFQDRASEGYASRTSADHSVDDYYCLSFEKDTTGRDALDAVTCASVFSSDKGRFMRDADVGYAEPFEEPSGAGDMRELSPTSLYPPRRDVDRCTATGCYDHADVAEFKRHALEVMPELDAITQATPQGQRLVTWRFPIDSDWDPERGYTLFIEANVEGDYNEFFDPELYPTPENPNGRWDSWAKGYGYPYRGQPSVVYALPFTLEHGAEVSTRDPLGYGDLHGESGALNAMNESVSNDADEAPGSGADRLRLVNDARASVRVFNCAKSEELASGPVQELRIAPHPDPTRAHMWARLSFRTPQGSDRLPVAQYHVRIRAEGGDWEPAFTPDREQALLPVALDVCADPDDMKRNRCLELPPGSLLDVDLAGLRQSTHYDVSVSASSGGCAPESESVQAEFTTPMREFTTVSPCFVATAAYGSPLAQEIGVLRRFRDRHLLPNALGRQLVDAYYTIGPALSAELREHPWLREVTRSLLDPLVELLDWWLT